MKYTVCVNFNFHIMDESKRYTQGEYERAEDAIIAVFTMVRPDSHNV